MAGGVSRTVPGRSHSTEAEDRYRIRLYVFISQLEQEEESVDPTLFRRREALSLSERLRVTTQHGGAQEADGEQPAERKLLE